MSKLRYSEFYEDIDIDAFEAAIGWSPERTNRDNDVGFCLFPENHQNGDTTGKFGIHRDRKLYNCYVCGGGTLLSLVMELFDWDVDQSTEWLHKFVERDSRSDAEFRDYLMEMLGDVEKRVATMPYFNARVLERFDGPVDYFRERGISDSVIAAYDLCYHEHLMKPSPVKRKDGSVSKIDEDYWGPTAIFPHFWKGKLVGWQHRWMEWDKEHTRTPKWLAKYTNTTDFPKSDTLYNYDIALRVEEPVVVCESVPTVLFLASYDVPAVSYFGSKPTEAQLRLLRRLTHGVILAPDNDSNGDALINVATALERFIPVFHADKVDGEDGSDLGDYAQSEYPERELRKHLEERVQRATIKV